MFKSKVIIKYSLVFLFIFLFPIIITFLLYPPREEIIYARKEYPQADFKIENLLQKRKPTIGILSSNMFSIPPFSGWYKVYIINNSILKVDPKDARCKTSTSIFLRFLEGDPRIYGTDLNETTEDSGGYDVAEGPGHPLYYLTSGEKRFFVAPSWMIYSIHGEFVFGERCEREPQGKTSGEFTKIANFRNDMPGFDYTISIKPHWPSWIITFFIINILSIYLFSSILSIWNWLNHDNKTAPSEQRK